MSKETGVVSGSIYLSFKKIILEISVNYCRSLMFQYLNKFLI